MTSCSASILEPPPDFLAELSLDLDQPQQIAAPGSLIPASGTLSWPPLLNNSHVRPKNLRNPEHQGRYKLRQVSGVTEFTWLDNDQSGDYDPKADEPTRQKRKRSAKSRSRQQDHMAQTVLDQRKGLDEKFVDPAAAPRTSKTRSATYKHASCEESSEPQIPIETPRSAEDTAQRHVASLDADISNEPKTAATPAGAPQVEAVVPSKTTATPCNVSSAACMPATIHRSAVVSNSHATTAGSSIAVATARQAIRKTPLSPRGLMKHRMAERLASQQLGRLARKSRSRVGIHSCNTKSANNKSRAHVPLQRPEPISTGSQAYLQRTPTLRQDPGPHSLSTVSRRLARPVIFNQPNCTFCKAPSSAILGSSPGEGVYDKFTRLCPQCTLSRMKMFVCRPHHLEPLRGCTHPLQIAEAFARLKANTCLAPDAWCCICPNLAVVRCTGQNSSAPACGLLLCSGCAAGVGDSMGRLDVFLDKIGNRMSYVRPLGLRADIELLQPKGALSEFFKSRASYNPV